MRRRLLRGLAALAAVAALAGWMAWSYLPRPRAARPEPGGLAARLLSESPLPVALWIPYPHQNLAAFERGLTGDEEARGEFLAAAARLAGLPEIEVPRFGPFAAPPSRELVAVSDRDGRRVLVAARVHLWVAVVARLAGKVAGNPWLAGGEVEAFSGPARVVWDGRLWTVGNLTLEEALGAARRTAGVEAAVGEPAFARLRLADPISFLPAGSYRLARAPADRGSGFELVTAEAARLPAAGGTAAGGPADPLAAAGAVAFLVSGPGGLATDTAEPGGGGAAALFAPERAADRSRGGLGGLLRRTIAIPGAAVWYRPGGGDPGRGDPGLLGGFLAPLFTGGRTTAPRAAGEGNAPPWSLVATGRGSLERARRLTPRVEKLSGSLRLGLWIEPQAAFAAVDPVADLLDTLPLVSHDEFQRWRDWRTVLAPLAGYRRVVLVTGGGELALRLQRTAADGLTTGDG